MPAVAGELVAGGEGARGGAFAGPHLYGAFQHGDLDAGQRVGADVELRAGDADGTGRGFNEEGPRGILGNVKESLARGQTHAPFIPP